MASPSEQPVLEREQIEQKLIDGGIKLQRPPSSTEDLLELLDVSNPFRFIFVCVHVCR